MPISPKTFSESLYLTLLVSLGLPLGVACGGSLGGENGGSGGGPATGGSTTTGGATSTGGTSATGGSLIVGTVCSNPTPNSITGLVDCSEGYSHRPVGATCSSSVPRTAPVGPSANPTADQCVEDSECSGANAFCKRYGGEFPGAEYNGCVVGCTSDAECGDGQYCLCGDPVGTCVSATCRTDRECDEGFLCVGMLSSNGSGCLTSFAAGCQRATDECLFDADCGDSGIEGCSVTASGRVCQNLGVCGRPFLIADTAQKAALASSDAWTFSSVDFEARGLSPDEKKILATYYAECGLLEHASIAAFARHSLELLALGAPPELVLDATNAMLDETRHARLCFSIASNLNGNNLGPATLPVDGALDSITLERVLVTTILEGVIGETRAALELRLAASRTKSAELGALLDEIAADESRHAALAFRFVRFALLRDPSLEAVARETLRAARAEVVLEKIEEDALPKVLLGFGMLAASERHSLALEAFDSVILPCFEAIATQEIRSEHASFFALS